MNRKEVKNVLLAGFLVAVLPVLAACTMPTDIPDDSLNEPGPAATRSPDATSTPAETGISKPDIAPTPGETSASLNLSPELNSALSDLVITSGRPAWTPSAVAPGDAVVLQGGFTVKNQGDADAGPFSNGIYLSLDPFITPDDIYVTGNHHFDLAAGTEFVWDLPQQPERVFDVTIPVETPPGKYYLGIMTDNGGEVAESNETNNYISSLIEVLGPRADLRFTLWEPVVTPSAIYPGGEVTLADFMFEAPFNEDSARPSIGFYLSEDPLITPDDTLLHMDALYSSALHYAGLYPDQTLKIPAGIPAGVYYLGVLLDPENAVAESNEDNNSASIPIKVMTPLPDLIITPGNPAVIGLPAEITPGGRVSLSLSIKNQGRAESGDFATGFYLSEDEVITETDTFLGAVGTDSLVPGDLFPFLFPETKTLDIPADTPPGLYYIGIVADVFQEVSESDENNTFVSAIFRISPRPVQLPDLVIISGNLTVSPLMVAAGGQVHLSAWRVENQGNTDSGQFVDGIYLSEEQVITATDTLLGIDRKPNLAPGGEIGMRSGPTVTIPSGTAPGIYYIGILIDKDHVVTEADETNNTVIVMIYVLA